MKNNLLLVFIIMVSYSCTVPKSTVSEKNKTSEKRCKKTFKNGYSNIKSDKFISIVKNDTIKVNEVKYECTFSPMYTKKVMYDNFGKWDKEIYSNNERHPNLIWYNVRLFENDTTKFTVITRGFESSITTSISIMVFDNKNNDLLSDNSPYKQKLVDLFSQLIFNNNPEKNEFYNVYWKKVDPAVWKIYKNHN